MKRWTLLCALLIAVVGIGTGSNPTFAVSDAAPRGGYVVVVHPSNPLSDPSKARTAVRQLYLKEREQWPEKFGTEAVTAKPFGRAKGSDVQDLFIANVLQMSEVDLARHWLDVKQKTGKTEPRSMSSERMILKMVAKYPGAFGLVSQQAASDAKSGVKILFALTP